MAVGALILLRMMPWPADVLEALLADQARLLAMTPLPHDEITALKFRDANENPRYDVGLFGNSRILMVGRDELALGNRRVFNFSIAGESIRQSIRLLEELRAHGKAPAVAVISFDYVELGLPGGLGVFPGPPRRWLDGVTDAWIAWTREGLRGAAVQIINSFAAEEQQMAITFNHFFVRSKLRILTGTARVSANFLPDGSQKETIPVGAFTIKLMPRRANIYPQLESDFARLAAIRDSGVRVLVYESPVAPSLGSTADDDLSVNARDVRHRFREVCAKYRLECYGPPALDAGPRYDRDHAPTRPRAHESTRGVDTFIARQKELTRVFQRPLIRLVVSPGNANRLLYDCAAQFAPSFSVGRQSNLLRFIWAELSTAAHLLYRVDLCNHAQRILSRQ